MAIIVQKFGGTSVATPKARTALLKQVSKCKKKGNDLVIVVSAMGRNGDHYATDTLINLLKEIDPDISPKKKDLLMSCGEVISCALIAHFLDANTIPSESLTGFQAGIITDNNFNNSEIINIDTANIKKHLENGKVVVVAGFQGVTINGEITTLGRGGSDTAAVAIGGYLKAERVDIFTDVPGIAEIDPRIVPNANYLPWISYDNIYKLASNGANVIHPRAVKTAEKFNIKVSVRSTFSDNSGTLISSENSEMNSKIIGIAVKKNICQLKIEYNQIKDMNFFINNNICYNISENIITIYCTKDNVSLLKSQITTLIYKKYPLAQIFLLFNKDFKAAIYDYMKTYLSNSFLSINDIFWSDDNVKIYLPVESVTELAENIYDYYHNQLLQPNL